MKCYDFYAHFQVNTAEGAKAREDINNLTRGSGRYAEISDVASRVMLLSTAFAVRPGLPDRKGRTEKIDAEVYAKVGEGDSASGLKALTHSNRNFNGYIACQLSRLHLLGIDTSIDISQLPAGSWLIEFPVTLAKPFISRDDVSLYIIENPVRKDKVFGAPLTSAMAWKGNLRWAMMKVLLEPKASSPEEFAETRFRHTLLFGTEKGMEERHTGWADYLDNLCAGAKEKYQEKFGKEDVPHVAGMLHFYPTFWDKIDMEVINPHSRKTKTGKNPIYFEVVPEGANGFFRLVYVPFYHMENQAEGLKKEVIQDLQDVTAGLKAMMLTYGFSAKKSTGYGVVKDSWDKIASRLMIKDFVSEEKFGNFGELEAVSKKSVEAR
jgi:CRISPR-associated protein Cmr2